VLILLIGNILLKLTVLFKLGIQHLIEYT